MIRTALRSWIARLTVTLAVLWAMAAAPMAQAGGSAASAGLFEHPKYASIVVDANTGEVLYALRADQPRVPASITKIMTLYLTFEALETGRIKLSDPIRVSAHAAGMIPSKTALRAGETLTVDEAIRVVAVLSANDIATALAEHLAGSEPKFAQLMTLRAQELGMRGTHFVNASGVPEPTHGQITTARDIAILSRAVMRDYPQYYSYFSQASFDFRGRHLINHNHLLLRMPGVDGLKTGYTNAAGFNLAASALRDGRRIITVVLGGSSTAARDENVEDLLSAGFSVLNARAHGQTLTVASLLTAPLEASGALVRPGTEFGSGDQGGLQVAAADPQHLPGQIDGSMMNPVQLGHTIRTATHQECVKIRTTVVVKGRHGRKHSKVQTSTQCRQSSAPGGPTTQVIAKTVVQQAPDCARLRGRARTRCRASEQTQVAASTPQCDKVKGRKARASCRRIESEGAVKVAAAGRTCTGKGRHRVCKTSTGHREDAGVSVASAKLRDCAGKRRRSAACRASEKTAVASAAVRHGKTHGKAHKTTELGDSTSKKSHRVARAG